MAPLPPCCSLAVWAQQRPHGTGWLGESPQHLAAPGTVWDLDTLAEGLDLGCSKGSVTFGGWSRVCSNSSPVPPLCAQRLRHLSHRCSFSHISSRVPFEISASDCQSPEHDLGPFVHNNNFFSFNLQLSYMSLVYGCLPSTLSFGFVTWPFY